MPSVRKHVHRKPCISDLQRAAGGHRRTMAMVGLGALLLLASARPALSVTPLGSTSSPRAQRDAMRAIPFDKLDHSARAKVQGVLRNTSLYRRMPSYAMGLDPEMYRLMVNHPDVVVNIWQVLSVSHVNIRQLGAHQYTADDGAGTTCRFEFLYRSPEMQIVYAEGMYEGGLFNRTVRGRCLLVLRSRYLEDEDGRQDVAGQLDMFVVVDNFGYELLAKTFQPVVTKYAEYNYLETIKFVQRLSRTAEVNPTGMARLAKKLTKVSPELRSKLAEISGEIAKRADTGDQAIQRTSAYTPSE